MPGEDKSSKSYKVYFEPENVDHVPRQTMARWHHSTEAPVSL